jgi:hypothetical protein
MADGTGHFAHVVSNSISGASGSIVTHDVSGKLLDSGILATSLASTSTVASISGVLNAAIALKQNEITITAGSGVIVTESPTDTWTIGVDISGGLYYGSVSCDTTNKKYTVSHPVITVASTYPVISLLVPTSGSNLFVQGITNRTTTSFDVILSEAPNVLGYSIYWNLPTTNNVTSSLVGMVNTLNSTTTPSSGSYLVTSSDNVVYADNANTIILPISPATNESHWIVNTYTSDITIDGNSKSISLDGVLNATLDLTPDSSLHIHFNATKDRWYVI